MSSSTTCLPAHQRGVPSLLKGQDDAVGKGHDCHRHNEQLFTRKLDVCQPPVRPTAGRTLTWPTLDGGGGRTD